MKRNQVIHGKWENILPQLESGSVHLGILDPPYNVSNTHLTGPGRLRRQGKNAMSFDYGDWDYRFNPAPLCQEMNRLISSNGQMYIFSSAKLLPEWIAQLRESFDWKILVWTKPDVLPSIRQRHWVSATEYVLWFYRGKYTFNFLEHIQMYNWQNMTSPKHPLVKRTHPNQKPLKLIERYIQVSSNPGDFVLDPMAGSCTTGIAAERLNREWLCIEEDTNYYMDGVDRINQLDPPGLWTA